MHRIMKNKKLLCSVCFLFTFMSVLWGQSITVKGNVTSKTDGQPVIGASVVEATATANGTITDLDGNMLFSGSVHDDIPVLDLTLSFEEKSFILTDNTHKQEWTGTYSLEKIDNSSSKLGLTFENLEEPVTGVYGTRVYSDDSESATITLQTDENILSFVGEDS